MSIPIAHEPEAESAFWGWLVERCAFCKAPTRYWHTRTNNPVCPDCAMKHRVSELRNWRKGAKA